MAPVGRRAVLAGALAPLAAWAADQRALAGRCVGAIRAALARLPAGPVLLNSYLVETGAGRGDFDLTQANAAYVYDNALAGLALLAAGDGAGARRIGQALALAQAHDRFWRDGRLRNAYRAGAMSTPASLPGWWDGKAAVWREDAYQVGSQTGPVAWAMLLWAALGMVGPANAAGDWLNQRLRAGDGFYGGFYGFEPAPLKLTWQSTEQNTDCFAAYRKLGRAADAAHAAQFVKRMFGGEVFAAGVAPDGARNDFLAADAGIWPTLAGLAPAKPAMAAVAALRRGAGIGFSAASDGVWPEGTAFATLADPGIRAAFLGTVAAQISAAGYVYASVAPVLDTGLTVGPAPRGEPAVAFRYFRRPSLSATAWAALAAMGVNPLA